jgi:hypothetical protein
MGSFYHAGIQTITVSVRYVMQQRDVALLSAMQQRVFVLLSAMQHFFLSCSQGILFLFLSRSKGVWLFYCSAERDGTGSSLCHASKGCGSYSLLAAN